MTGDKTTTGLETDELAPPDSRPTDSVYEPGISTFSQAPAVARPPRVAADLKPAWIAAGVLSAIGADIAFRRVPWNNLAGSLLIAILGGGLLASGFLKTRASKVMVGLAMVLAVFVAIRTEPFLVTFNILSALGLLAVAAIHGKQRSFWNFRPIQFMADIGQFLLETLSGIVEVPAEAAAQVRVIRQNNTDSGLWPIIRGLAYTIPLVLVLGSLLASADVVFQSFFDTVSVPNVGGLIGHVVLLAIGAYGMIVLLRLAATEGGAKPAAFKRQLGTVESSIILGGLNLLFAAFALAQLLTVLGGAEGALERAGLDPKQFARQGFFQLLWVAGITLVVLMTLRVVASKDGRLSTGLRGLSLTTVALTLVIVAVALTRIWFYIDAGGLTPLRFYSAAFTVWTGVSFLIVAARIWGVRSNQAWLMPVMAFSGVLVLVGLNFANPGRIIALDNIANTEQGNNTLIIHLNHDQFTADGNAVIVDNWDRIPPEHQPDIKEVICNDLAEPTDFFSFNLGERNARTKLSALC